MTPSDRPWMMRMRWQELLFMHYRVPAEALRPLLPAALELDRFEGEAWLGIVPFRMSDVAPRYVPAVPWLSHFPELNLRTYVTHGDKPGVWFFSLDAANPVAVRLARQGFFLSYYDARMGCRLEGDTVHYNSNRTHRGAPAAQYRGSYRPVAPPVVSAEGTLEYFLSERYCLYSADGRGRVYRGDIQHVPWPLQRAEAETELNTMTEQLGLPLPDETPLLHYAHDLEVHAWLPLRVA